MKIDRYVVENRLRFAISEQTGKDVEKIQMESLLEDEGMDSLDLLEVILVMEEELHQDLPDTIFSDDILGMKGAKLSDMVDAIMTVVV